MNWVNITDSTSDWAELWAELYEFRSQEYTGLMVGRIKGDVNWTYTHRRAWWLPLEGVTNADEAKAAALMLYKMR